MRTFTIAFFIASVVAVPAFAGVASHIHESHSQESHIASTPQPHCAPCVGKERPEAEPVPAEPAAAEPAPAEPAAASLDRDLEESEPVPAPN